MPLPLWGPSQGSGWSRVSIDAVAVPLSKAVLRAEVGGFLEVIQVSEVTDLGASHSASASAPKDSLEDKEGGLSTGAAPGILEHSDPLIKGGQARRNGADSRPCSSAAPSVSLLQELTGDSSRLTRASASHAPRSLLLLRPQGAGSPAPWGHPRPQLALGRPPAP